MNIRSYHKWAQNRGDPSESIDRDVRFISAKATRSGADVYVMAFVAEPNSIWQAPGTVLIVAEPAAMETGKVTIGADQLQKGLAADGRIALYGIYFDTGRAEAVVATLTTNYKIDAARLKARGVASFAPVATNRTEAGRAKNRRVELVEQ